MIDLAALRGTVDNTMARACTVGVSPAGTMLALGPALGAAGSVLTARAITGPTLESGLEVVPFVPPLVTIADDGAVAVCDGSRVLLARGQRVRPVRTLDVSDGGDEGCVTGAVGRRVVRLSRDRRRLVDVVTGRTVRRLAERARRPVRAIAASADGYVLIADAAGDTHTGTVYGPDGNVAVARRPIGRGRIERGAAREGRGRRRVDDARRVDGHEPRERPNADRAGQRADHRRRILARRHRSRGRDAERHRLRRRAGS